MKTARQNLQELARLLKEYLLQEYPSESSVVADRETFLYFRHLPRGKKSVAPPSTHAPKPTPSRAPPPPPIPSAPPAKQVLETKSAAPAKPHPQEAVPSMAKEEHHDWLRLNPLGTPTIASFDEVSRFMQPVSADFHLLPEVPDDAIARQRARYYQHRGANLEALVVSFGESGRQKTFLHNVAKAIDLFLCPCRLVSAEKLDQDRGWEKVEEMPNLRWLIAPENAVKDRPSLSKRLDLHVGGHAKLGSKSLLLLPQLRLYLSNPSLKAALWETIQKALRSRPTSRSS